MNGVGQSLLTFVIASETTDLAVDSKKCEIRRRVESLSAIARTNI